MDDDPIHILIVDDEEAHSALIRHAYKKRGDNVKLTVVEDLRSAREFLETTTPAVVIADWLLPDGRGSDLLTKEPDTLPYPVVVITSHGDELMAVDIIKAGAIDFIMKSDLTLSEMPYLIDRALHQWRKVLEHRQAQMALRESEERLRILFEYAPDGIVLTDGESAVVDINRAALRTAGLSKNAVVGKKIYELGVIDPEQLPGAMEMLKTSAGQVRSQPLQFRIRAPDGDWTILETRSFPIKDRTGILTMTILRDITERTRTEEALRDSNERYRTLVEAQHDLICRWSPDCTLTYVNKAYCDFFGKTEDQLLGKSWLQLVPEDHRQIVGKKYAELAIKPVTLEYEHQVIAAGGAARWQAWSDVPLCDPSGRLIEFQSVGRDITERKLAEQQLAVERNQLRTLIDNLPDAVWFKNTAMRFVIVNKAAARLLGAEDAAHVVGKTDNDFHPSEEAERYLVEEQAMLETGSPIVNREGTYIADGRPRWCLTTKIPLTDTDGQIIGIVGIARDITERKLAAQKLQQAHDELEDRVEERTAQLSQANRELQIEISERKLAEEALRQSQKRQKAILDTIPDVAWLKDCDGRYIAANEPFAEACGLAVEELIGKTDFDIWPGELAAKYTHDDAEVLRTGLRKWVEEPFADKTKKRSWVETIKTPIYNNSGRIAGTSGIARDLTQRKKMERKLRQSEKLAVAGRLAAKVAHEINNPLAGIKNSFLLIKDAVPPDHPYFDYVARIDKEISRVTSLVRRMFDLYRPETQSSRPLCVCDVINDVVALLNVTIRQTDVAIEVDVADDTAAVNLPEGMFRQVLFNIISNAVEASPPGQTVTVAAALADHSLNVAVTDHGHGIPEGIQDNIFEPFFTTKTGAASSGLGLGLAVSKSEVEAMGGSISFESKPGSGTRFDITIPVAHNTEKEND